jgi:hypothetical protein
VNLDSVRNLINPNPLLEHFSVSHFPPEFAILKIEGEAADSGLALCSLKTISQPWLLTSLTPDTWLLFSGAPARFCLQTPLETLI